MGVTQLWDLLAPVGRRINIEAIQNKRLAIGEIPCRLNRRAACKAVLNPHRCLDLAVPVHSGHA